MPRRRRGQLLVHSKLIHGSKWIILCGSSGDVTRLEGSEIGYQPHIFVFHRFSSLLLPLHPSLFWRFVWFVRSKAFRILIFNQIIIQQCLVRLLLVNWRSKQLATAETAPPGLLMPPHLQQTPLNLHFRLNLRLPEVRPLITRSRHSISVSYKIKSTSTPLPLHKPLPSPTKRSTLQLPLKSVKS